MKSEDPKNPQKPTGPGSKNGRKKSPKIEVLGAYEHGMVIETDRSFDVGSSVELGFHLGNSPSRRGEFVSAETIVVESCPQMSERGSVVHRVTLLFSEISRRDHDILLDYSRERSLERNPIPKEVLGLQEPLAKIKLIESFEEVFSLN